MEKMFEKLPADDKLKNWSERLKEKPIYLLPEAQNYTIQQLKAKFPGKKLVVCDFNVEGLDLEADYQKQINKDDILNIDHHSDKPEMERQISSTNLAIEYIKENGLPPEDWEYIAHHTDADSVLSNALMRGILPNDDESMKKFGAAAIAADHTGQENEIADLLQAVRDRRDLSYSLEQLQLLLDSKPLDPEAQKLLEKRYVDREKLRQMAESGEFRVVGGVAYAVLKAETDGALVPALLPEADVVLLFSPLKADTTKWEVKFRVGVNAPEGFSLRKLGIGTVDPAFGGRWNAGGNRRGGGTDMVPDEYAKRIAELVKNYDALKKFEDEIFQVADF